jgi:streptogramin lyase
VAVDSASNVYVADYSNHHIRKITPEGTVSTLADSTQGFLDGTGANAQFNRPYGVAVDSASNVYMADYSNHHIRKITPEGTVSTLAGSTQGSLDGIGENARFDWPVDVAVDSAGNVYVGDYNNHSIRKITPEGTVSTFAGSGDIGTGNGGYAEGPGTVAKFNQPVGVAVDSKGTVYVGDQSNHRVRKTTQ